MALHDYDAANYPGIKLDDTNAGPTWILTVKESLDRIVSVKLGRRLLTEICNSPAPNFGPWGGKVKILRPVTKMDIGAPGAEGGSRALEVGATDNAYNPGVGCAAAVYWNSNIWVVPNQGMRPPFIGLAHELIHAWHYTLGTKERGDEEERKTVGLGAWANDKNLITENKFRAKFGVALRDRY